MKTETYGERLRDPRWQKKRLQTLNEANWSCEICGDEKEELHVHHKFYFKDKDPWEYAYSDLQCLCDTCHGLIHLDQDKVVSYAAKFHEREIESRIALARYNLARIQRELRSAALEQVASR